MMYSSNYHKGASGCWVYFIVLRKVSVDNPIIYYTEFLTTDAAADIHLISLCNSASPPPSPPSSAIFVPGVFDLSHPHTVQAEVAVDYLWVYYAFTLDSRQRFCWHLFRIL